MLATRPRRAFALRFTSFALLRSYFHVYARVALCAPFYVIRTFTLVFSRLRPRRALPRIYVAAPAFIGCRSAVCRTRFYRLPRLCIRAYVSESFCAFFGQSLLPHRALPFSGSATRPRRALPRIYVAAPAFIGCRSTVCRTAFIGCRAYVSALMCPKVFALFRVKSLPHRALSFSGSATRPRRAFALRFNSFALFYARIFTFTPAPRFAVFGFGYSPASRLPRALYRLSFAARPLSLCTPAPRSAVPAYVACPHN